MKNAMDHCTHNTYVDRIEVDFNEKLNCSDNGIVMTCGDGSFGALGHGDWNSVSRPKLIEQLLR
jgi:NIMA (never in mitosis gene a)-related kinase